MNKILQTLVWLVMFLLRIGKKKPLKKLVIINPIEQITFNNSYQLTVKGFDDEDKEIKIKNIKWQVEEGANINDKNIIIAGNEEKTILIIGTLENVTTEIFIDIVKPQLTVFEIINPNIDIIKLSDFISLKIKSQDQFGYDLPLQKISWSTNNYYHIDCKNDLYFHPQAKGKYTIQAIANDYNKTASIEINIPTVLTTLKISPNELRLEPNKPYQFNVEAFDQGGEKMSTIEVKWTCDYGGEITDNGIFTGNLQEEEAVITARLNDVADSVTIQLLPILCSIEINPNYRTIEPHQSIQFSAEGFDQFHREFSLDNLQWYAEKGIINSDGYYQGLDYENEVQITAKSGEIKSSIILKVRDRSRLTTIKIIPEYISIKPNTNYQFSVIGLDQRNDRISIELK